jgi:hypothetical protein
VGRITRFTSAQAALDSDPAVAVATCQQLLQELQGSRQASQATDCVQLTMTPDSCTRNEFCTYVAHFAITADVAALGLMHQAMCCHPPWSLVCLSRLVPSPFACSCCLLAELWKTNQHTLIASDIFRTWSVQECYSVRDATKHHTPYCSRRLHTGCCSRCPGWRCICRASAMVLPATQHVTGIAAVATNAREGLACTALFGTCTGSRDLPGKN